MIMVDVFVPALDQTFDIRTDENNVPGRLVEELVQLLGRRTGEEPEENREYTLYQYQTGTRLKEALTLYAQGIRDGSRLLLV